MFSMTRTIRDAEKAGCRQKGSKKSTDMYCSILLVFGGAKFSKVTDLDGLGLQGNAVDLG